MRTVSALEAGLSSTTRKCFVAMPISTPADRVADYDGDADHFKHVLEYLISPALREAGYTPIPPAASGSTLILAEIVKNLEHSDLVLCDLSTFNPNVMLELGIRIALDRPICLIRDDRSGPLPFDTSFINTYTYDSGLTHWKMREQTEALAGHILATRNANEDNRNPLWKAFGLTQRAQSPVEQEEDKGPLQAKVELLTAQVDALLQQQHDGGTAARSAPDPAAAEQAAQDELAFSGAPPQVRDLLREATRIAGEVNARVLPAEIKDDEVVLDLGVYVLGLSRREDIINLGHRMGLRVRFLGGQSPDSPAA
ncbi:hypothetical protein J2S43_007901 [Catenuloplanes nepalensis]|uniref:Nucleoside 2-deoxyribosyltransferase n=1 Tax=Catenuloplanes nepalensis TaxID=587533 RepID=A0ABT9N6R7_9ACTN|nr:hypothetical protein [Catenuloplanes nepalensis]MDP9799389.1 hypothetical protein [Catenuloplanes nepalensis]